MNTPGPPRRTWHRSVVAPALILVVGVVLSVAAGRDVARTADRELAISLERGASEIGMVIQGLTLGFESELASLAAVAAVTDGDPVLQQRFVEDQQIDDGYVLVDSTGGVPTVLAAVAADPDTAARQRAAVEGLLADPGPAAELQALADRSAFGFVLGQDPPVLAIAVGTGTPDGERWAMVRTFDVGEAGLFLMDTMAGVDRFAVYIGD
jgi:hypothetical protein